MGEQRDLRAFEKQSAFKPDQERSATGEQLTALISQKNNWRSSPSWPLQNQELSIKRAPRVPSKTLAIEDRDQAKSWWFDRLPVLKEVKSHPTNLVRILRNSVEMRQMESRKSLRRALNKARRLCPKETSRGETAGGWTSPQVVPVP